MPELRKVQETNKRTLIISLPKRWGPRFPVVAGDHLRLDLQADGSVVMRRHGEPDLRAPVVVSGTYCKCSDVLGFLVEPFLAGASGVEIRGLQEWLPGEIGDLRDAMREGFGAEVLDETSEKLQVAFLGADRPDQARPAARRLVQLACAALRGEAVSPESVRRHHLLVTRLVFLASALAGDRRFQASASRNLLRVADLADFLVTTRKEGVVDAATLQWFEGVAMSTLEGVQTDLVAPPRPTGGLDCMVWSAASSLHN